MFVAEELDDFLFADAVVREFPRFQVAKLIEQPLWRDAEFLAESAPEGQARCLPPFAQTVSVIAQCRWQLSPILLAKQTPNGSLPHIR